jgi:hypothetical protein
VRIRSLPSRGGRAQDGAMGMTRNLAVAAGVTAGGCGFHPAGDGGVVVEPDGAVALLDGASPDAVHLACPADYAPYALRTTPRTHADANADCEDDLPGRTHLATFEIAAALDDDLEALAVPDEAIVYLGGVCRAAECDERRVWFWTTGPAVDESLWPPGQPNQGTTQHALAAQRAGNEWILNNIESDLTQPYLCECEP